MRAFVLFVLLASSNAIASPMLYTFSGVLDGVGVDTADDPQLPEKVGLSLGDPLFGFFFYDPSAAPISGDSSFAAYSPGDLLSNIFVGFGQQAQYLAFAPSLSNNGIFVGFLSLVHADGPGPLFNILVPSALPDLVQWSPLFNAIAPSGEIIDALVPPPNLDGWGFEAQVNMLFAGVGRATVHSQNNSNGVRIVSVDEPGVALLLVALLALALRRRSRAAAH